MLFQKKSFQLWGILCLTLFAILFMARLGLFKGGSDYTTNVPAPPGGGVSSAIEPGESYMAVFQNGRHIGFSHRVLEQNSTGFRIFERAFMKINTMGMVQDLTIQSDAVTESDLSLRSFDFEVSSGRFQFRVKGAVEDMILGVTTAANKQDYSPQAKIRLTRKPFLIGLIAPAMAGLNPLVENDRPNGPLPEMIFSVFDPVTMGEMDVGVRVVGEETMAVMGQEMSVKKLAIQAKGMTQYSFVDGTGRVVREEGLLGITLVAATRQEALKGIVAGDDLTLAASVIPVWDLEPFKGDGGDDPVDEVRNAQKTFWNNRVKTFSKLTLKISGIDPLAFDLDGGRQILSNNRLTIIRESLGPEPEMPGKLSDQKASPGLGSFLEPGPLVQSDHPDIQALASRIIDNQKDNQKDNQGDDYRDILEESQGSTNGKIRAVLTWMDEHIEKRPLVSLPNAISTLENRMGDCNEHAVLFAALCRSLGIPTRIEAGLVFLNDRFFYHAWNGVFLGSWITVDPLFNQFPADVTHLRLVSGQGAEGFDIMGAIGRIKVEITGAEP